MTTISSLASAAALSGTEPLPVDQSGATVKATVNQVKTYVNTSPAITGGSINSTPIGATTPSTGAFTSLIASGAITNSPVLGSSYIYSIRSSQTTGQVGINLGGGTGGTDWLLYQPAYSNVLTWYGAAANRMTLDTSGNLAVTGNISSTARTLVGTTTDDGVNALQVNGTAKTTGIKFANTGGTKQALDYYEEGTWTPTLSSLGGTITTPGTRYGRYTVTGRVVTLTGSVTIATNGTGSAYLTVGNLPFAMAYDTSNRYLSGTCVTGGFVVKSIAMDTLSQSIPLYILNLDGTYPGADATTFNFNIQYLK